METQHEDRYFTAIRTSTPPAHHQTRLSNGGATNKFFAVLGWFSTAASARLAPKSQRRAIPARAPRPAISVRIALLALVGPAGPARNRGGEGCEGLHASVACGRGEDVRVRKQREVGCRSCVCVCGFPLPYFFAWTRALDKGQHRLWDEAEENEDGGQPRVKEGQ
ncbi:hypothetical protein LIA77_06053 [Sarocladium implicatum]|nr:hypothetical protein LIA77_06053 [Sarocladium implicatum]